MKFLGRTSKCITDADGSNMEWNLMLTCTFPINGAHSSEGALLAVGTVVAAVDIVVVGGHAVGCSSIPITSGRARDLCLWTGGAGFLLRMENIRLISNLLTKFRAVTSYRLSPAGGFTANVINIYKKIWLSVSAENSVKVDGRINETTFFV